MKRNERKSQKPFACVACGVFLLSLRGFFFVFFVAFAKGLRLGFGASLLFFMDGGVFLGQGEINIDGRIP